MDIKKVTKGLAIAGAIGTLLTAVAAIIKVANPAASDLPVEYRQEIKKLVSAEINKQNS